eukprot:scaffold116712_cov19-Prasinocladus_malaysianus.AAC.2
MDLLGADLPAEDGQAGDFQWADGPLLTAIKVLPPTASSQHNTYFARRLHCALPAVIFPFGLTMVFRGIVLAVKIRQDG